MNAPQGTFEAATAGQFDMANFRTFGTEKIRWLLEQQNALNLMVKGGETWVARCLNGEWDYRLQAAREIGEFLSSYETHVWWAAPKIDVDNCQTELVDALHFMLSEEFARLTVDTAFREGRVSALVDAFRPREFGNPVANAKRIMASLLTENRTAAIDWGSYGQLCLALDLPLEALVGRYELKWCINMARWHFGYKQDKNVKYWGSQLTKLPQDEDNAVMSAAYSAYQKEHGVNMSLAEMAALINSNVQQAHPTTYAKYGEFVLPA